MVECKVPTIAAALVFVSFSGQNTALFFLKEMSGFLIKIIQILINCINFS